MTFMLVLSVLALTIIVIVLQYHRSNASKANLPPGPRPLPIIGNLHQMTNLPFRTFYKFSRKYGPIVRLRLGRIPYIVISSPRLAEQILKTQDLTFCNRPPLVVLQAYSFGADMASCPNGPRFQELRKIFSLHLLGQQALPSSCVVRDDSLKTLLKHISNHKGPVNLSDLVYDYTSSFINLIALGDAKSPCVQTLEEFLALTGTFWAEDFFPGFGWVDALRGLRKRVRISVREFDRFLQDVIDRRMDKNYMEEEGREAFVDVLIKLWKGEEKNAKGALMNILFGATETSASAIIWSMTELIRNPHIMEKAQNEVRDLIKNKGKVEQNDLSQLVYLKSVIKESLRLHPLLPLLVPRECISNTRIDGYDIPAKTVVFVNVWAIGRDETYWENAMEFNPDRFLGSKVDYKGNHFEFLPFGAGRRICPGMNFGVMTVELALANLLYAFDWELPQGMSKDDVDMMESPGLAVSKKIPLLLVAKKWIG